MSNNLPGDVHASVDCLLSSKGSGRQVTRTISFDVVGHVQLEVSANREVSVLFRLQVENACASKRGH